ncbi:S41 family peptidase [Paludibacteraceae bacterium OttesenSCG-928-F17]|nr:S41 family peptidase [Paludibacteraceae bacterium OttesenSCG-928-F17]
MKKTIFFLLSLLPLYIFAQGISPQQQRKLNNALMAISSLYVDSINDKEVIENTITSVLKELDPHSSYIPLEEVQRVREPLQGSFEGVGIAFQLMEDTLLVIQTVAGAPAERVGVMPGDRIITVDGETIAGVKMQNSDIMKRLRGVKGSEVEVEILRRGEKELMTFKIIRDKIPVYTVDAQYMIGNDIGYIKINSFGSTTVAEYMKAFNELKAKGMKHLILNLQGNGGGYLGAAIELADQFLPNGEMIVYTEGLHQPKQEAVATAKGNYEKGRLIVLIDEYSASASEIVSGAIQDWDRGVLVGRRTFGKGLVQRELELVDGSLLRLTTARYYTPTGRSIQKPYKGVKYEDDLKNRYQHGEFSNPDSIQFSDSLKYETLRLKRAVYGGGGIMPDVFIPIDTTKYTDYHRKLVSRGIMNKTNVRFIENNREQIKQQYPDFARFKQNYEVSEDYLRQLIDAGENDKVPFNEEQYNTSKELIKIQLKSLIARDIWDTNEYYQIIDEENESLKRAVQILETKKEYEKILK